MEKRTFKRIDGYWSNSARVGGCQLCTRYQHPDGVVDQHQVFLLTLGADTMLRLCTPCCRVVKAVLRRKLELMPSEVAGSGLPTEEG